MDAYFEVHTTNETGGFGNEDGRVGGCWIWDGSKDFGFHNHGIAMFVASLASLALSLSCRSTKSY